MKLLRLLLVLITEIFASWTLAYHFALLVRLPARMTVVPFLAILLPLLAWSRRDWPRAVRSPRREWSFAGGVLFLGALLGLLPLLIHNANPDDYNYFHRAVAQLDCLDQPFFLTETGLHPSGLPQLSIPHTMTSYEPGVALAARLTGMDPLECYFNGMALLSVLLVTAVLSLLYRHFRLGPRTALAATLVAVLYMATDLRHSRCYGTILLYGWIGKALLWGVLLPWTVLLTWRFLRRPNRSRFVPLLLCGVCAPGLTGSGLFLFPVEIACVSLAYLLQSPFCWRRLRRVVFVNAGGGYCLAIAALALTGAIPRPANTEAWIQGWPATWWQDLGLVFSSRGVILRDALMVFLIPWIALPRPFARVAMLLGVAVLLVVANPLSGPLWMGIVTPAAYWRFVFLLPLAWYAGLIIPSLARGHTSRSYAIVSRSVAAVGVLAMVVVWRHSYFWPPRLPHEISIKSPWELRLPRQEAEFARRALPYLHGRYVLGPESVSSTIALLDPTVRFDAVRGTEHCFANARLRAEGLRRLASQRAVSEGDAAGSPTKEQVAALDGALRRGVDAVILVDSQPVRRSVTPQLSGLAASDWRFAAAGFGYALYLRVKE